jgi:hypothetical protein
MALVWQQERLSRVLVDGAFIAPRSGMRMETSPGQRPMRLRTRREIYKGSVLQACARKTAAGTWQPVVLIQLSCGDTEFYQRRMVASISRTRAQAGY